MTGPAFIMCVADPMLYSACIARRLSGAIFVPDVIARTFDNEANLPMNFSKNRALLGPVCALSLACNA